MIANYGYQDGTGEFYISIDTDKCCECSKKGCLEGCPGKIFEVIVDDWDDQVAAIKDSERNKLRMTCTSCKPNIGRLELLPCQAACSLQAIKHSW